MNSLKKALAHACDNCPLCKYARNHPETTVGKIMEWHGKFCPMWKGQKELEEDRKQSSGDKRQE